MGGHHNEQIIISQSTNTPSRIITNARQPFQERKAKTTQQNKSIKAFYNAFATTGNAITTAIAINQATGGFVHDKYTSDSRTV